MPGVEAGNGRGVAGAPDGLSAYLRQHGFRLTPQRVAVAAALEATAGSHPTAEELSAYVQAMLPTVSLATVYNTLAALVEAGFVLELDVGDGPRRYDLIVPAAATDADGAGAVRPAATHAHVRCVNCGELADVELPAPLRQALDDEIREQVGYRSAGRPPALYGLCPACQRERAEPSAAGRKDRT